jgi:hypothetical protein
MGDFAYLLVSVLIVGSGDPIVGAMPVTPFISRAECEKRIMQYLDDGFEVKKIYGKLEATKDSDFSLQKLTCVMISPRS